MVVKNLPKLETLSMYSAFKYTKSFTCESRHRTIFPIVDSPEFEKYWAHYGPCVVCSNK